MAITLSDAALTRARELAATKPGSWLRIGIRGGGCSGFSYFLDVADAPTEKDKQFTFGGDVQVLVDKKSYLFLNGTEVDFEQTLVRSGFVFKNPQASSTCSCGESFSIAAS